MSPKKPGKGKLSVKSASESKSSARISPKRQAGKGVATPAGQYESEIGRKIIPSERYVAALTGSKISKISYQIPHEIHSRVKALLKEISLTVDHDSFIQDLSILIGQYRILNNQDAASGTSESEAITKLQKIKQGLTNLRKDLDQIGMNENGVMRIMAAWGNTIATRPQQPLINPVKSYSIQPIFTALEDLETLLSIAITFPRKSPKGGRQPAARKEGFVREFYRLCQSNFQENLPSITGGPLKKIIGISMKEIGWPNEDIRHLLNILKPKARR